jgi:hypothetical protein
MLSSIVWTAAWVRQWYVFAWFASIVVSLLAAHTFLTAKVRLTFSTRACHVLSRWFVQRQFRSASGFDWRDERMC